MKYPLHRRSRESGNLVLLPLSPTPAFEPVKGWESVIEDIAQPTSPYPSPLKGRRGTPFEHAGYSNLPLRPIGGERVGERWGTRGAARQPDSFTRSFAAVTGDDCLQALPKAAP